MNSVDQKRPKRLIAIVGFLAAVILAAMSSPVHAQELPRVTIDAAFTTLGNIKVTTEYPADKVRQGPHWDTNGFDLSARVRVHTLSRIANDEVELLPVSVGFRQERDWLRNARFFHHSRTRKDGGPSMNHVEASARYQEIFGSFTLPGAHDHALIIGVARDRLDDLMLFEMLVPVYYGWESTPQKPEGYPVDVRMPVTIHTFSETRRWGLVIGGEGKQALGNVTMDYAGRWYPRMNRQDKLGGSLDAPAGLSWPHITPPLNVTIDSSASGFELRGTTTWWMDEGHHFGIQGGGEYRRLQTESPIRKASPANIESQPSWQVIIGTRLAF